MGIEGITKGGIIAGKIIKNEAVQESFNQLKNGFLYRVKKHMDSLKNNGCKGVKRQIFGGSLTLLGGLGLTMTAAVKTGILAAIGLGGIAAPAIPIAGLVLTAVAGIGIIFHGIHAEKKSNDNVSIRESLKTAFLGGFAKIYSFFKPNWEKDVNSQNAIAMIKNSLSSLKNLTADGIKREIQEEFGLNSESINLFECLDKLSINDKTKEIIPKITNNLKAKLRELNLPDSLLPNPNKSIEQQIQDYQNTLSTIKELSQDPKKILEKLNLSKDWLDIETLKNVSSKDLADKVEALTANINLAKLIKEKINIEGLQNLDLSPFLQLKLDNIKAYKNALEELSKCEKLKGLKQFSFSTFQNALKQLENSTINELAVETVVDKLLSLESKDKASYQKIIQNALKQLENSTTNELAVKTVVDKLLSLDSNDRASYQEIIQDALKQLENSTTKDVAVKTVVDKLLSLDSNDRAFYIEKIKDINDMVKTCPGLSEITLENLKNLSANLSEQTVFNALQTLNVMSPGSTSLTLDKINDLIKQEKSWKEAIAFLKQDNLQELAYAPLQAFVTTELQKHLEPIQAIINGMLGKKLLNDKTKTVINTINSIISENAINELIADLIKNETALNLDEIDLNKIQEGMQQIINERITLIEESLKQEVVEQSEQAFQQLANDIFPSVNHK